MNQGFSGWARRVRSLGSVAFLERQLSPRSRREVLAIVAIVAMFTATFFLVQRTPGGSDDCVYFEYAAGRPSGAPHHQQRYGLIAAIQLAQAAFGYTSLAYYSVPFVYGMALMLACYFAARAFTGVGLSLLAAMMVLALPTILVQGTWLLADIPSMFWIVLGAALFLRALTAKTSGWPLRYVVGSGLCLYLAVLTKESTALVLLGLGFFPLALMTKRSLQILLATAAVTLVLALVELCTMQVVFGDVWHRLHAATAEQLPYMTRATRSGFELPDQITWGTLATRFLSDAASDRYMNGWQLLGLGYWDWLVVSLPLGVVVAALRKNRLLLGLFGFVFWSYLSLSVAVVSFDPLIPMVITKARYFLVVLVWLPILVVAGWSCFWAWPWQRWQRAQAASVVVVCALYVGVAYGTASNYVEETGATIHNGNEPLTDSYSAVTAFIQTGGFVQRVVGSKELRAARFAWPDSHFEIFWRGDELTSGHRLRPHDFVVAEEPMALQAPTKRLWRALGGDGDDSYFYIERPKLPHPGGQYGMVVAKRAHLLRRPEGARLDVQLELDVHRVEPTPLKVIAYDEDGKQVVISRLHWKRNGRRAAIDQTTHTFRTLGAEAVSVEFRAEGTGRFFIEKVDFQLLAPNEKPKRR